MKKVDQNSLAWGVIILGAGNSFRMGRPKLLLPWNGTTIIGHLIQQWQALKVEQIAIVQRSGDQPLAAELDRLNFSKINRVVNPGSQRGMFSSIQCAAHWPGWKNNLTAWILVLGDQPHLQPETLESLLAFYREHADKICQPALDGRAAHPVILPRRAFFELQSSGAGTLKEFLQETSCQRQELSLKDLGLMLDLDTPEDYQRAMTLQQFRDK